MKKEKNKKINIQPLQNRVLLKPLTKDEVMSQQKKNNFGIILPDNDKKEKSEQGIVVAVGEGEMVEGKRIPVSVKVGDTVVFSKYGYEEIEIDGEELYFIKEDNILAVIK